MSKTFRQRRQDPHRNPLGFSLIEMMLAMSLGIGLSGAILQLLISESDLGLRVNRLLRERSVQKRTLALIRDDVRRASRISTNPLLEQHACSLSGRLPVLHLTTDSGPITYSIGTPPSAIWRGQVLMRCGPAFDLTGQPSGATTTANRVLIDRLARNPDRWKGCPALLGQTEEDIEDLGSSSNRGFAACLEVHQGINKLGLRLLQEFPDAQGHSQAIESERFIDNLT